MGFGIRIFLIDEDDKITRIPATRFERIRQRDPKELLSEYKNSRIRYAEIILELKNKISPEDIESASNEIVRSHFGTVIIDCSNVQYLEHAVLGKLYMLKLDLSTRSRNLIIKGCSERILSLFRLIGLDTVVQIVPDVHQKRQGPEAHQ